MVKIALQHWIVDVCIGVLFDNIFSNFMTNNNFSEGDVLDSVRLVYSLDDDEGSVAVTDIYNAYILRAANGCYDITYEKMIMWEPMMDGEDPCCDITMEYDGKKYCGSESHDGDFSFTPQAVRSFRKR